MMTICAKQETENESLRAKLEERTKFMSYADALRGRVTGTEGTGGPSHLAGASAQEQAHPAALTQTDAKGDSREGPYNDEYEEGARKIPRMYIIHVGINDLLKGHQPEDVVEVFRKRWSSRKASLTICSVPEVVSKGKAVQAATMMLNAKIKGLCRKIRARYVDLSAELNGHNAMDKDGVHYGEMGACVVSQQLAQVARRFLEGTVQRGDGGTASQSWKAAENLERHYQWNREEQRTKPPFGFNDACSPKEPPDDCISPAQAITTFLSARFQGSSIHKEAPTKFPANAEVRQQLPYPAVANYTPTPGLEQQVRYVDSNIHLPPATGAAHNNLAAFGWPPEMPPLHPQRQTDSSGGLLVPSSGPWTSPKTAHVAQLYTHVVPPLPLHDLRAIVTEMVNQQLDYHCQRQKV
ncbi:hypothetical protein HPB47_018960 [Ixodes persulcatus]|uniref:Uncharacterized protein n=1 Tax=Ixodes persulcatus TaxID=34615 RepID=A0AC60R2H3_IXOPE|nr:hypothetical protein HPB47_018960 [Ixodes persulcatus]